MVSCRHSESIRIPGNRFTFGNLACLPPKAIRIGLTPTKYQSGETDRTGRISKIRDGSMRAVLYEAAHVILTKPVKSCTALKSWAMRLDKLARIRARSGSDRG
jgi:transposase